ncbi:MAG: hypothetical protein EOO75_17160, partial [Myxococcales bacterium]
MTLATPGRADPKLRVQVDQRGDFAMFGNTLGYDCVNSTPNPVNGQVGSCTGGLLGDLLGATLPDTAPDVFWMSDTPGPGQARANVGITPSQARSTAVLNLPTGASITHAYLYWAARRGTTGADLGVTLTRPGVFDQPVTAVDSYAKSLADGTRVYQSVADVTTLVKAQGGGAYRVSGVDAADWRAQNNEASFAGWWMVVFYQRDADPTRNLALFDGFD